MTLLEYLEYLALFNSQSVKPTIEKYYAEDIHFEFPGTVLKGRDAALQWFESVHDGVFETLVPVAVEVSDRGTRIVATLEVNFFLTEDTSKTPKGPGAKKGDAFSARNVVVYHVNERNQFSRLVCEVAEAPRTMSSRST